MGRGCQEFLPLPLLPCNSLGPPSFSSLASLPIDLPPELVDKWSGHEVTPNFAENELDLGAYMVVKLEGALGVEVLLDWEVFQARPCLLLLL